MKKFITTLEPLDKQNEVHLKLMYEVRTHPDVASYLRGPPPKNYEQHAKYLQIAKDRIFFIIKANQIPCGYCHLTIGCQEIEMGWALHPSWWGKSIGSTAVKLLVEYTQTTYPVGRHKYVLFVQKDNVRAIHIYKKNGFMIQRSDDLRNEHFMCLKD